MLLRNRFRNLPDPLEAGELRIGGGGWKRIGADSIPADPAANRLRFEVAKGIFNAPVVFGLRSVRRRAVLYGPAKVIFGIVQQKDIQRLQLQALEAAGQLVLQKRRMDAVLQPLAIGDQIRERLAPALALLAFRIVLTLEVARL